MTVLPGRCCEKIIIACRSHKHLYWHLSNENSIRIRTEYITTTRRLFRNRECRNCMTKETDLRFSFMSHFLACGDKSCTRLKDLLDRNFLEAKARHYVAFFLAFVLPIPSVLAKGNWNCPYDPKCGRKRQVSNNTLSLDLFNYCLIIVSTQRKGKICILNMSSLYISIRVKRLKQVKYQQLVGII